MAGGGPGRELELGAIARARVLPELWTDPSLEDVAGLELLESAPDSAHYVSFGVWQLLDSMSIGAEN